MALQKSPISGVAAVFQDLDILMYVFAPEKILRLGDRIFCLAINFHLTAKPFPYADALSVENFSDGYHFLLSTGDQ